MIGEQHEQYSGPQRPAPWLPSCVPQQEALTTKLQAGPWLGRGGSKENITPVVTRTSLFTSLRFYPSN